MMVLLPAVFVGCTTIYDAHDAQKAVLPKANGDTVRSDKINLRGYSLSRLVDFALTNRPSVLTARLAVDDARLNMKALAANAPLVSSTPWNAMQLSVSGNYGAASDASSSRLGWHTEGNASAALSLDLLVWDFGRNSAEMTAAAERVVAAEKQLTSEGYAVFEDVSCAYFAVLEADALLEVARTNECEFAEHLRQAQDKLEAGEAQRLDVTRARLDLSQARQKVVSASNLVVTSGTELMRALGVDVERGTRYDVLPASTGLMSSAMRGFAGTSYSVDAAFELARTNAPSMAIVRARLRASSSDVDRAIADLMPSISASASLNWTDPLWLWQWGVGAAQSLFTGFRKTTAVERAVVAMKSAAAAVDETEQELSQAIGLAVAERDNAKVAGKTAWASVQAARENYDTVKEQYREGDASRVDFTDAISDYATSVGSCITAFYRGQIAEARLFALTGKVPAYREEKVTELQ